MSISLRDKVLWLVSYSVPPCHDVQWQRYKNEVWRKNFIAEFFRLQELYEFRFHLHGGGQQHR